MDERVRGFEVAKGFEGRAKLPIRKTKFSAGYDLSAAEDTPIPSIWKNLLKLFTMAWHTPLQDCKDLFKPTLVSTGIKAYMPGDEYLFVCCRSSSPLKRLIVLANGAGVVDKDYYGNKTNDGDIKLQFYNFSPFDTVILRGEDIGQAVFQKFLITDTCRAEGIRDGGHGSTDLV